MGCYAYMIRRLQPLGLYDLEYGAGAEELRVVGAMLDEIAAMLEEAEAEASVLSASGEGLAAFERLLPYVPACTALEDRRASLAALLRIDGRSFTLDALRATLSGCGIAASVGEGDISNCVEVSFPGTMGEPEQFEELCARIEQILPCHLEVRYLLRWLLWSELDGAFTWSQLETQVPDWDALEKLRMD